MLRTCSRHLDQLRKRRTVLAPCVLALFAVLVPVRAEVGDGAQSPTRVEARAIIGNARKIVTPGGVERVERVSIGGIDQWVSIRGTDRRNPVLLDIHGGRGLGRLPLSWGF